METAPAKGGQNLFGMYWNKRLQFTFIYFFFLFNSCNDVIEFVLFGGTEGLWATVGGNLFPVGTAVGEEKDV